MFFKFLLYFKKDSYLTMFCFSIFLVLQSLLLVCHLLPSPLSSQPLIAYLPTHSLLPCLLACSFFYSFLPYLLTRFPIRSLLAYLFVRLLIHPLPPISFLIIYLHQLLVIHRLLKYPLNLLLLVHHLLLHGTTLLFTYVGFKAKSEEANCNSN